jgi:hypothetical protein
MSRADAEDVIDRAIWDHAFLIGSPITPQESSAFARRVLNDLQDAGHLAPEGSVTVPREALRRYLFDKPRTQSDHVTLMTSLKTTKGTDDATG